MKDLGVLTAIASGAQPGPEPVMLAAGVLRCLERQQGTALMLSSVIAALGYGAAAAGRGAFMVEYLTRAAIGLAEDMQDMKREGVLPMGAPDGFEIDAGALETLKTAGGELPSLTELIIAARAENVTRPDISEGARVVDLTAARKLREG